MFPVYSRGPIHGARPLFMVTQSERREMISNGSAKPVNRGTAIQLLLTLEQLRGESCQMGPRVIERAASEAFDQSEPGHHLAQAAALAYQMIFAGSYCPLIPKMA